MWEVIMIAWYPLNIYVSAEYFEAAKRYLEFTIPGLVTGPGVAERYLTTSMKNNTHPRHKILQKLQSRVVSDMWMNLDQTLLFH